MINEYWQVAPTYYKGIVLTAMAAMGVGIVLLIVRAASSNAALIWPGIGFVMLGAVLHVIGFFIRARGVKELVRQRQESMRR